VLDGGAVVEGSMPIVRDKLAASLGTSAGREGSSASVIGAARRPSARKAVSRWSASMCALT